MDKLNFLTAGIPACSKSYKDAFDKLNDLGLDGLEFEFVHGVRLSEENITTAKQKMAEYNLVATAHGPYYINLNSKEPEKIDASIKRIIETAKMADTLGAYSITYHAAFYMGEDKKIVFDKVLAATEKIMQEVGNSNVWVRPETTGKATQWGDLEEIVELSKHFDKVLPCVDFSHLHARYNGISNTYDEFAQIFDKIGNELGNYALENFHAHIAGIEYSPKGEKKHLNLPESDFNYKDLLKAFKDFNVKGTITCESPNIEIDTKLLKDYYLSL